MADWAWRGGFEGQPGGGGRLTPKTPRHQGILRRRRGRGAPATGRARGRSPRHGKGTAEVLLDRTACDARVGTRESMGGTPMLRGRGGFVVVGDISRGRILRRFFGLRICRSRGFR